MCRRRYVETYSYFIPDVLARDNFAFRAAAHNNNAAVCEMLLAAGAHTQGCATVAKVAMLDCPKIVKTTIRGFSDEIGRDIRHRLRDKIRKMRRAALREYVRKHKTQATRQ